MLILFINLCFNIWQLWNYQVDMLLITLVSDCCHDNFTIQHGVYWCCHSNHYSFDFSNVFCWFWRYPMLTYILKSFHQYIKQGRILSFVNQSLSICILKSLAYRWTYNIGWLHRPHSSNISEIAWSIQTQFHIKSQRHLGNKHLLKWSSDVIRISALPIYIVLSRGGQGAISPPKNMNETTGLDEPQH